MAYEYGYPGTYSPYSPSVTSPAYPMPAMPQRPYTGVYGANGGMSQGVGMQAPQLPSAQPQQSNVPWIQVPNIEAARNVMVQPNQTAYMMNQNAPEFYVKSTDQMGVATLRCFAFQEFNPTEQAAKEVLSAQADKLVSREEFNNYAQAVNAQFNAIQQALCSASGQMTPQVAPPEVPAVSQTVEVQTPKPATKKKELTT